MKKRRRVKMSIRNGVMGEWGGMKGGERMLRECGKIRGVYWGVWGEDEVRGERKRIVNEKGILSK